MTPAEHARLIEQQEFEAERKAVRQRALQYSKQRQQQERDRINRAFDKCANAIVPRNLNRAQKARARRLAGHTKLYTYNGEAKSLSEWSDIIGTSYATLSQRLRSGMDIERALTMKPGGRAKLHTVNGVSKTMQEWADHIGITYMALMGRLQRHSLAEAIAMPANCHPKTRRGVSSDLKALEGTGAGSIAQEIPEITFSKQADNA
jgi:hypothetical protein